MTTSQLRNSAKAAWTLEELDWHLHPPGDYRVWDGLIGWYVEAIQKDARLLSDAYLKCWHRAALKELNEPSGF